MAEKTVFALTNDGKFPCIRVNDVLHYESIDEVAKKLHLTPDDYDVVIDKEAAAADNKDQRRKKIDAYNRANAEEERWGC